VPIFPFWLINLASALLGVRLASFAAATALGVIPATFVFRLRRREPQQRDRRAAGRLSILPWRRARGLPARVPYGRRRHPELLAALAALGVLALVPVVCEKLRAARYAVTRPLG
jgi:hypothetical protein